MPLPSIMGTVAATENIDMHPSYRCDIRPYFPYLAKDNNPLGLTEKRGKNSD